MNRRAQVAMSAEEQERYLDETRTLTLASVGPDGWPHLVAMWFCLIDGRIMMTSFAKAQKAVNIRRDPRVTLSAESGAHYSELRGLMIRGEAELVDDFDTCVDVMRHVQVRMRMDVGDGSALLPVLRTQARKRVVIRVTPLRVASWDHTKLGGVY